MRQKIDTVLLNDVFRAYFDARRNKRNTFNQMRFEMNFEENLIELAYEVQNETYKVGRSTCFVVNHPVKREIFAADFRDRVVHHLVCNYIGDFFERRFITDTYSCRKGFGTSFGIERIVHHSRSVTQNYTRSAYVLKLDLQGYFMSINRDLLFKKIEKQLVSRKNRKDKNVKRELYLIREIIYNDPTINCLRKGSVNDWDGLPKSKSLFSSPQGCGLPIGNLTSQLFSNVYLMDFDNYVKNELKTPHYGRYVDDFFLMDTEKHVLLQKLDKMAEYLKTEYGLFIHPRKIYLQKIEHGITFLGAHIKPYRNYISSKTLKCVKRNINYTDYCLRDTVDDKETLLMVSSMMNSYFGYLKQFSTKNIRIDTWKRSENHHKYFKCNEAFSKIKLREYL